MHTHSSFATTLACLARHIPAFHYEVAFAGGNDIRCAPYRTFGTQELSDAALAALEGRGARACSRTTAPSPSERTWTTRCASPTRSRPWRASTGRRSR